MLLNTIADLNSSLTLNPFDPALCFLAPETGSQLMIARYVEVGTLAVSRLVLSDWFSAG